MRSGDAIEIGATFADLGWRRAGSGLTPHEVLSTSEPEPVAAVDGWTRDA